MIKFGVLRADADGVSLIGLHFVEARQRTLCWRTSGSRLGYFWLRQSGVLFLLLGSLGVVPVSARDVGESSILLGVHGQQEPSAMGLIPNVLVPDAAKDKRNPFGHRDSAIEGFITPGWDRVFPMLVSPVHLHRALYPHLTLHGGLNIPVEHQRGCLSVVLDIQFEHPRCFVEVSPAGQVGAINLAGSFFRTANDVAGSEPQKDRGEGEHYRKQGHNDLVVLLDELALANPKDSDVTSLRDWLRLSLLVFSVLCLLLILAVCVGGSEKR
jgi:hypothetical protein